MKKFLKNMLFGRKSYQRFFERLFDISIGGMNIGTGGGIISGNGELHAIRHALKNEKDPVVFDVGAQGGDYTKEAIFVTEGRGIFFAFEPNSADFKILSKTLDRRVKLYNIAFSDKIGKMMLYSSGTSGLSSFYKKETGEEVGEEVLVETIDSFCSNNNVNEIDLLKLDVEGHELACLRGARRMLPHIKNIQFEISKYSRDSRVYFRDIFESLGDYKVHRILKDGLVEIKSPGKLEELLYTTNYLAVRRNWI